MSQERRLNITAWTTLTTIGLAGGLIGGLFLGMSLSQLVNAMVVTAAVTCAVGTGLGATQAFGLKGRMNRPLAWVVATAVGMGIGLAVGVVLVEQVGILLTGERPNVARLVAPIRALSFLSVGLVAGMAAGAAQAVVLKLSRLYVSRWIAVCGIGLAMAFATSSLLVDLVGLRIASAPGFIIFVLASGITFGVVTAHPLRHAV